MKILVTGGAGYIGSVAVELLIESGHEVIVIDDLSTGHEDAVHPEAKFYQLDIGNKSELNKILKESKVDIVMHFAAASLVGESVTNPQKYFENNVIKGMNLLECIVTNNINKIIFSSTCATYGIPSEKDIPIDESLIQKPVNPYGESKLVFENALKWYSKNNGLEYIALRYFNVAGASEARGERHTTETHLIPLVFRSLKSNFKLSVYGNDYPTPDGTAVRDYIHVVDLIEGHILAMNAILEKKKYSNAYNIGYGKGYSVLEIIKAVEAVTGEKVHFEPGDRREGDPSILIGNSSKIKNELGWSPKYDNINTIIKSAIDFYESINYIP